MTSKKVSDLHEFKLGECRACSVLMRIRLLKRWAPKNMLFHLPRNLLDISNSDPTYLQCDEHF